MAVDYLSTVYVCLCVCTHTYTGYANEYNIIKRPISVLIIKVVHWMFTCTCMLSILLTSRDLGHKW